MFLPLANEQTQDMGQFNPIADMLTVIVVLAIIIVLIIVLVRFLGRKNRLSSTNRSIQTMGAVGLGPNKSLQVIQIGGAMYLVGVGENINLVDKITDPDEIELLKRAFEEADPEFPAITSALSNLMTRFKKKESFIQEEELEGSSFHEVFQTQIQKRPNRKQQIQDLLEESEQETTDRSRDS